MGFTLTSDEAPWHRRYTAMSRPLEPEFSSPLLQRGFVWHVVEMMACASARPPSSDGWVSQEFMDMICPPELLRPVLKVARRVGLVRKGMHPHPFDGDAFGRGYIVETQHDDKLIDVETREQRALRAAGGGRAGRIPQDVYWQVVARDGDTCRYCAVPVDAYDTANPHRQRTLDHCDPDGDHVITNLVVACKSCNSRKAQDVWTPKPLPEGGPRYNPATLKKLTERGLLHPRPEVDLRVALPSDDHLGPVDSRGARPGLDTRDASPQPTTPERAFATEGARANRSLGWDGQGGAGSGLGGAGPGPGRAVAPGPARAVRGGRRRRP